MRALCVTVAMSMLIAGPALAGSCGSRPSRFTMVNGLTADQAEMRKANNELISYTKHVNRYLKCLIAEAKDTRAEAAAVKREFDRQVGAYNAKATSANQSSS